MKYSLRRCSDAKSLVLGSFSLLLRDKLELQTWLPSFVPTTVPLYPLSLLGRLGERKRPRKGKMVLGTMVVLN
jgi:hypothetical protein